LRLGNSIAEVMLFLITHHITLFISAFAVVILSNRLGLVRTLRIRFVFLFVYLFLLYLLQSQSGLPIYFVAIVGGMEGAFYWIPINTLFTRYAKTKSMAKQMSHFFVLPDAAGLAAPLIGGVVAGMFGFPALFVFAFIINIAAVGFLRGLSQEKTYFQFSWIRFKEIWRRNKIYFISEFFDNITEEIVGIIFPIVIYLSLHSVIGIGLVGTFLSVGMMGFTLIIGKFADHYNRKKMLRLGALLLIATFLAAFLTQSATGFYVISILLGFFLRFFLVPYNAFLYQNAKTDDAQFLVLRELPVISARVFVFLLAIFFAARLEFVFFAAIISLFYFFLFNPRKQQ
jgi:MFS family permease